MTIKDRFEAALLSFTDKIKCDANILSVILYGSLSNDTVWEKSDMDVNVLVRDMKMKTHSYCIEEDGLIINVNLQTEFAFKRDVERSLGGGWMFSMFSQARVIYARDESFIDFMEQFKQMGEDDRALAFFNQGASLIYFMEKIEKWLTVKGDAQYAQFWVLKSVDTYANMRLVRDRKPPSREAVLKVMEYAPEDIKEIYLKTMQGFLSRDEVQGVLDFYKAFLLDSLDLLVKPVADYMTEGAVYTVTTLVKHFDGDSHHIYHIFDFLEEAGVVARVTEDARLTPKGRKRVEEVAFIFLSMEDRA